MWPDERDEAKKRTLITHAQLFDGTIRRQRR
jgi:hypothetical protein